MQVTLKSHALTVIADTHGGELHSVKDNAGVEYIWQAAPEIWPRHAPVLFPMIGNTKDKKYLCDGKEYTMSDRHGFARDMEFSLTENTGDSAVFTLKSSPDTLKYYPYDFALDIRYTLENTAVKVLYTVKNTGSRPMYFYIGGHPAFNCPLTEGEAFEDYSIEFSSEETLRQTLPDGQVITPCENSKGFALSHALFDNDAIVHDAPASKTIALKSRKTGKGVEMDLSEVKCITIWSPLKPANFVCLEPWTSVPIEFDSAYEKLEEKPHAIRLEAGQNFTFGYSIRVIQ